MAIQS
jgi:hypothetical protein